MIKRYQEYLLTKGGIPWRYSSNRSGYRVNLVVKQKRLIIEAITFDSESAQNLRVDEVFGVKIPAEGLTAVWFEGNLTESFGEWRRDILPVSSHERVFVFKQGVLIEVIERKNERFESGPFSNKKTEK